MTSARPEIDPTFDEDIGAWFGGSMPMTPEEMEPNVFRFDSLPQSDFAFIDAVLPGHERVLYGAIGGSPYKMLSASVEGSDHYNVDFIRAEPGNGAALHSHDTQESFICLAGRWLVGWGDNSEHIIELDQYDGIMVPAGVMRRFENISDSDALLLAIVGGKDPGHVIWANSMRDPLLEARNEATS